jgi:hypothetical protein
MAGGGTQEPDEPEFIRLNLFPAHFEPADDRPFIPTMGGLPEQFHDSHIHNRHEIRLQSQQKSCEVNQ